MLLRRSRAKLVDEARLVRLLVRGFAGFHLGHTLGKLLRRSGEDRAERAQLGAGLETAPLEIVEVAVLGCLFYVAQS